MIVFSPNLFTMRQTLWVDGDPIMVETIDDVINTIAAQTDHSDITLIGPISIMNEFANEIKTNRSKCYSEYPELNITIKEV